VIGRAEKTRLTRISSRGSDLRIQPTRIFPADIEEPRTTVTLAPDVPQSKVEKWKSGKVKSEK
jgi:hypothetical protein